MLNEYVKYYYDKLPEKKKKIYLQMYRGLREHKNRMIIDTGPDIVSVNDLYYIFRCVYNDTPSFYYVDVSKGEYIRTSTGYVLINYFLYTEDEIQEYDKQIISGLKIFYDRYINSNMTDYEKEMIIHDYLTRTVVYDHESINDPEQNQRHREIYNVLGPLLRKKAVCWGIACAFKLLCDYCKVKCFVVIGDVLPLKENSPGHAWI